MRYDMRVKTGSERWEFLRGMRGDSHYTFGCKRFGANHTECWAWKGVNCWACWRRYWLDSCAARFSALLDKLLRCFESDVGQSMYVTCTWSSMERPLVGQLVRAYKELRGCRYYETVIKPGTVGMVFLAGTTLFVRWLNKARTITKLYEEDVEVEA